jgi:hypothetical protein
MASSRRRAGATACLAGLLLIASAATATPRDARGPLRPAPALSGLSRHPALAGKATRARHWRKVGEALREAVAEVALAPASGASALRGYGLAARLDGRVHVSIRVAGLTAEDRDALDRLGCEITFQDPAFDFVEAWVGVTAIERLAGLDFVRSVRPAIPPVTSTGSVTSEGDALLGADAARAQLGVTGAGVTVGVLSDSVDGLGTAQASGDLPPVVQVLQAGSGSGEGTAMLEIVHDLAPGAGLAFYGPSTSGDMIAGIRQLAASGASVIVDDLTFFDQPHFEEGPIAQAINQVAANGVVYVTSAGNYGANRGDRGHYEADFVDAGALGGPVQHAHAFTAGSAFQDITVRAGATARIFLQWSNRFGAAADDYDLYVVDGSGQIVARSDDTQDGNDLPVEIVTLDNSGSGSPVNLSVVVDRFSGASQRIELYYAGGITNIQPATPEGSIAGNANAAGALTVAAINASDPGTDTAADYSSRGPCDLFFPARETRAKPEVTAIDGVAVTGAAGFPSPFFGTSAAAPHAAAVAALLRSARPGLSVGDVRAILANTALDLGASGFDVVFGAGRIQALAAVSAALATGPTPGGGAPVVTGLRGRLDGDVLTLTAGASDADGDVVQARALLLDPSGASIADSGPIDFRRDGQTAFDVGIELSGLGGFPTAVAATLVLVDARGLESAPVVADFTGGDPGAPALASVAVKKRGALLQMRGGGFVRKRTRVEINGVLLGKAVAVKRRGALAIAKGKAVKRVLRAGPNRVRLVTAGGGFSNLLIVNR